MAADDHLGQQFKKRRKPGITPGQIASVWGSAYGYPGMGVGDEGDDAGDLVGDVGSSDGGDAGD